ncbi:MAG: hypothetical protein ACI4PF_03175 [Christensenellales bacterium]
MELNEKDKELVEMATQIAKDNADINKIMKVILICVLKAKSGKIYKGINLKTSHSVCAEQIAIGQAFVCGERELDTIVTVKLNTDNNTCRVVSPCGLCRYTFNKLKLDNLNVIVEDNKNKKVLKVKASELLPYPYTRY